MYFYNFVSVNRALWERYGIPLVQIHTILNTAGVVFDAQS